jgi:hypothetical protein
METVTCTIDSDSIGIKIIPFCMQCYSSEDENGCHMQDAYMTKNNKVLVGKPQVKKITLEA